MGLDREGPDSKPATDRAAMNILVASSEVVPFAKTGGLADVTGALPRHLAGLGQQVHVIMPGYRVVDHAGLTRKPLEVALEIPVGNQLQPCRFSQTLLPDSNVTVTFVEHEGYFDRPGIYGEDGQDYQDNCQRFVFFSRAVLEAIRVLHLSIDVIHANDWQTGLIPALLVAEYRDHPSYRQIASLLTIHNLAYQGVFPADQFALTGLDGEYFNWQQMEFYGQLNLLKTGLVFADAINTVSPTYAREIQSAEQGCGLEGVLQHRGNRLSGILNGIDVTDWDPASDPHLPHPYQLPDPPATDLPGKAQCKAALQEECQLPVSAATPLIGIVGRLAAQKGWSLILPVLRRWLETEDAQWVILGTGDPDYHSVLTSLHRSHPHRLSLNLAFSNPLAHRIEAGADLFLMPSHYEPCGLNQMYSMAYGTPPVVRQTGGLADTVIDATPGNLENQTATGFVFRDFTVEACQQALRRAVDLYRQHPDQFQQLRLNGMRRDWSWKNSARQYVAQYQRTFGYRAAELG